jgi:hypothetical protein
MICIRSDRCIIARHVPEPETAIQSD